MNRLILLGNGFDLAHGLKTGYNDFIRWYLTQAFEKIPAYSPYEDELVSIKKRDFYSRLSVGSTVFQNVADYIDHYYQIGFSDLIYNRGQQIYATPFIVNIKSPFLEHLLINCSCTNWVDIENEYYEQLKPNLRYTDLETRNERLEHLNSSLKELIKFLEIYLTEITQPVYNEAYGDIFEAPILKKEIVTAYLIEDQVPQDSLILNFNYTPTVEYYFKRRNYNLQPKPIKINYIHGQLGNPKNPLIFGFGDELDDDYLKMELEKTKGFLEHIKSFWYFKTSNYHDLIRFIDSEDFQVFILGHSCGLSDRTMLNMIFEHENCKSIKIFYHQNKNGENNFTSLTQEISKHFRNKGIMRRKIVPFDKSTPMPQIED